jgi:hypothetical protein
MGLSHRRVPHLFGDQLEIAMPRPKRLTERLERPLDFSEGQAGAVGHASMLVATPNLLPAAPSSAMEHG